MYLQNVKEVIRKIKHLIFFILVLGATGLLISWKLGTEGTFSPYKILDDKEVAEMSVEEVLIGLNDDKPIHYIATANPDSVRMGEEIVKFGRLKDKSNKRLSKYFVCTDCHNQVKESADPSDESPESVLQYGMEKKIAFLPASTFYGMYNKRHWYNGDYAKKYGDLVTNTRDTLFHAIELCATQCSQGRPLDFWEVRSIMHYFKSLEYQIADLKFSPDEIGNLSSLIGSKNDKAVNLIKGKYNEINDAHFGSSKIPEVDGYSPSFEKGEYIYTEGCLHCHSANRNITNFNLGKDPLSYKFLTAKKDKYTSFSISHITRYGTYAISGRKQYMPQYSYENMSDEQMLDLMYYIETKAAE
jgi:mono/diheme cytochrome c family protein